MEKNDCMDTDKQEAAVGALTRLLTGWGISGSLARILAGALLGAIAAFWALKGEMESCIADSSHGDQPAAVCREPVDEVR